MYFYCLVKPLSLSLSLFLFFITENMSYWCVFHTHLGVSLLAEEGSRGLILHEL